MNEILVLGCGMVGSAIAADLSNKFKVTAADKDEKKLSQLSAKYNVNTREVDISSYDTLPEFIKDYDIVVNAVPGSMGFKVLKTIIPEGKNIVDISFMPEDSLELDSAARENNVTVVVDCGVAPGLSNIILGYHYVKDDVISFTCYVGGLPFERTYPYQYKAPFSPADVIEEYVRPARIKERGEIVVRPALSETEFLEFKNIGTLEAFNSDGLRTLLKTIDIPDMKEKTLRYPGHVEKVKFLRDSGFFSSEEIEIGGSIIKPLDLSSKLLFDLWHLKEEDDEFTVMKVIIETKEKKYYYNLFDRKDRNSGFSSMARTTGYTCTAAVNLLAEGKLKSKGVCPPEMIGMDEDNFKYVLNYLKDRNIILEE
jgi:lysine 6-dehydrogenase